MSTKTSVVDLQDSGTHFISEARSIQKAAQAGRARVVRLGQIVFFSTLGGDAWMLDPEEGAASYLACHGDALAIPIRESREELAVEWQADYHIDGRAFVVTERASGSVRTILGYPVEEIEQAVQPPAAEPSLVAARERLKTGRNERCPCGSGRKYKKCCLRADEEVVQRAVAALQLQSRAVAEARSDASAPEESIDAAAGGVTPPSRTTRRRTRKVSETERRLDELWQWFESLSQPAAGQMDELLEGLLALPPEATEWNDVLHTCAQKGHADVPAVFRKIAAAVPHTRETAMSSFYWAAAEEFSRRGLSALLPEVADGFARLDEHSYDADALVHLQDFLLAERFETEALALAERFLPVVRADDGLMPYAPIEQCNLVFQLRAGMALRSVPEAATTPQVVAQALRHDLEEDIEDDAIDRAARVACEAADPAWTRACFDLVTGNIRESEQAWRDCLRLYDALLRVAREAWRIDGVPSGSTFVGLSRLLESVYRAREQQGTRRRANRKTRREPAGNLLEYLDPSGMEERIARACPDLLGVNVAQARILVDAHTVLLDFATRHGLMADGTAAVVRTELVRLRGVLVAA